MPDYELLAQKFYDTYPVYDASGKYEGRTINRDLEWRDFLDRKDVRRQCGVICPASRQLYPIGSMAYNDWLIKQGNIRRRMNQYSMRREGTGFQILSCYHGVLLVVNHANGSLGQNPIGRVLKKAITELKKVERNAATIDGNPYTTAERNVVRDVMPRELQILVDQLKVKSINFQNTIRSLGVDYPRHPESS